MAPAEIIANEVTLPDVEEIRARPGESIADRVAKQALILIREAIEFGFYIAHCAVFNQFTLSVPHYCVRTHSSG